MDGYKVLTNSLCSAIIIGPGMVEYKVGEWAFPPDGCGPLAVFVNLEAARCFADRHPIPSRNYVIYTCEFEMSTKTGLWNKKYYSAWVYPDEFPPGTLFANRVMIKEVIANGQVSRMLKANKNCYARTCRYPCA